MNRQPPVQGSGARSPLVQVPWTGPADPPAAVALTFDDGPGPHTGEVLEVLARYDVRATFFVCGRSVRQRPDLVREIARAGHQLGNHTFSHPQIVPGSLPLGHFDELDEPEQADQIDRTTAAVEAVLGAATPPIRFFRGPAGRHRSATTARVAAARGLTVVEWGADTGDWQQPGELVASVVDDIVRAATHTAVAGTGRPIVLLHDHKASAEPEHELSGFRGNTVAALPRIVEFHLARGAAFCAPDGTRLTP